MHENELPTADCRIAPRPGDHPVWLLALLALVLGQGWLTLGLFGAERSLDPVLNDQPLLTGRHPLHLYHGFLGARALFLHGTLSCYDPAFYAGYPKTPVFDSGSRPAELVLALAGGRYNPAAYKIGLLVLSCMAPVMFWLAARAARLTRVQAGLATVLGLLVWWGQPCQDALAAGEVDLLLATVLVVAQSGMLVRYHESPCPVCLLGLTLTGFLGWLAHPLLLALLLPLFLIYYVSVGVRHHLAWHLALLGGLLGAVAVNGFWLLDWIDYWWLRVPLKLESPLLERFQPLALWNAPLWGAPADRALALALLAAAVAGVLVLNQTGQRPAARLFGVGTLAFLGLAVSALLWEALSRLGAARLLLPALWFACVPAAYALGQLGQVVWRYAGLGGLATAAGGATALLLGLAPDLVSVWKQRLHPGDPPLAVGLDAGQRALLASLEAHTTLSARILWEDQRGDRRLSCWTALLPMLSERVFMGGLDPDAGIEHTSMGLCDGVLAGRPLGEWSDEELEKYCRRYNIGWVVCWSEASQARLRTWTRGEPTLSWQQPAPGWLFTLPRRHGYALAGSVSWLQADAQRIVLSNVIPEKGVVVLSLHYQAGLRISPGRVRIEPELDDLDPIPLVRLLVDEPVARLTITFDRR
jgi:hypothetical protein